MVCTWNRGLIPGSSGSPGKHMGHIVGEEFSSSRDYGSVSINVPFHCHVALSLLFSWRKNFINGNGD